ncbi:MAG: hypothetical protein ACI808_000775 [Paraglaciecola sp.]|jgi:hypothetical protein
MYITTTCGICNIKNSRKKFNQPLSTYMVAAQALCVLIPTRQQRPQTVLKTFIIEDIKLKGFNPHLCYAALSLGI